MSFFQIVILGTISGLTIFLGMPLARLNTQNRAYLAFLNAVAIGVLFFLFADIVIHAAEPIEDAITQQSASATVLIGVLIVGFSLGLLSLVYYERQFLQKGEAVTGQQIALLIAIGIGLHNFSEGLAIGNAGRSGDISFALLLIVGFGLHNMTEAFGIAAPLVGHKTSVRFLGMLGLIAGGPNFLGTLLGYTITSEPLAIFFLALAAGAMIYVIGELFAAGRKFDLHVWNAWGLVIGFLAGLLTDLILIAAGG